MSNQIDNLDAALGEWDAGHRLMTGGARQAVLDTWAAMIRRSGAVERAKTEEQRADERWLMRQRIEQTGGACLYSPKDRRIFGMGE